MIPAHAEVDFQFIVIIIVEVGAQHLTCVKTTTVPPSGILFFIIKVAQQYKARFIGKAAGHASRCIAVLGTCSQVEIGHVATVHTFLNREVEHSLLLTIVDTSDTRLVALLVVELHILYDVYRDILQRSLNIAKHKLLTINKNLLHFLTINGDVSVFIDLGTRNTLDEFLDRRALGGAIGLRIVHKSVFFHYHLCCATSNYSLLQHDTLRLHQQIAKVLTGITTQRHLALDGLIAYR